MIVIAFLLLAASILMLANPEVFWMITESWKGNGDEPSDFYKKYVRFGGVIFFLVSVFFIIIWIIEVVL